MLNIEGFKIYLEKINFGSIGNYISYLNMLKTILNEIKGYSELTDEQKVIKFASKKNDFKEEFDRYHNYSSDKTFSDLRSGAKKYVNFLQYSKIKETMELYKKNSNNFPLNDAYLFFRLLNENMLYPIKALCKPIRNILELSDGFTTHEAKAKLNNIFNQKIEYIDRREDEQRENLQIDSNKTNSTTIKNIILYGSPGVGKTYNTKKLISLIESGISEKEIFKIIKNNELDDVVNIDGLKDRVKFVTFHQSFGYEDFIEGFRPNEEGKIKLVEGVFKSICNDSTGIMKLTEHFSINREIHSERSTYIIDGITNDLIKIKKENGDKIVPIPTKLVIELLEHIQSSDLTLDDIKYRNLDQVQMSFDKYMYGYNSILYAVCKSVIEEEKISEQKNYYLVIDEINRGNISKIFGELITLIEEDKRDTFEVMLPYSKKPFKIPSNLYIIGTMNSTDKSIALIDIALRRRFTFLKMEPNINLVDNNKAKNIMKQLNEKITETLGADYVLGHSYFMKIESDDDLEFVLEYKVMPLLEEYFYGDEQGLKSVMQIVKYNGDDDTE